MVTWPMTQTSAPSSGRAKARYYGRAWLARAILHGNASNVTLMEKLDEVDAEPTSLRWTKARATTTRRSRPSIETNDDDNGCISGAKTHAPHVLLGAATNSRIGGNRVANHKKEVRVSPETDSLARPRYNKRKKHHSM